MKRKALHLISTSNRSLRTLDARMAKKKYSRKAKWDKYFFATWQDAFQSCKLLIAVASTNWWKRLSLISDNIGRPTVVNNRQDIYAVHQLKITFSRQIITPTADMLFTIFLVTWLSSDSRAILFSISYLWEKNKKDKFRTPSGHEFNSTRVKSKVRILLSSHSFAKLVMHVQVNHIVTR